MQYIPCNSALLAQEALLLPKKALLCPKISKKSAYIATNLNSRQNSVCLGLKFSSESKLFGGCHPCYRATSATLMTMMMVVLVVVVNNENDDNCWRTLVIHSIPTTANTNKTTRVPDPMILKTKPNQNFRH